MDFVVHFHGWRNTVAGSFGKVSLDRAVFAPVGKKCGSAGCRKDRMTRRILSAAKLEDTNGFARFMAEAAATLRASGVLTRTNFEIGNLILSGHSGGLPCHERDGWIMAACPRTSRRFGCSTPFTAARITSSRGKKRESGRLLDIYTDHGGTKEETEKTITSYKQSGASFFAGGRYGGVGRCSPHEQTGLPPYGHGPRRCASQACDLRPSFSNQAGLENE